MSPAATTAARGLRLLLAASLLAACSSDASGPGEGGSGGSAFEVTVSGGTAPRYSWPGGMAHSVSVVRVSAPGTIVWGVANPQQGVGAPVTHGAVPTGSLPTAATEPRLTAGVRYRVSVTRLDTKTGWTDFTP